MNKREFFKLVIGTAACTITPVFAESRLDVRGWRFGVWTITDRYGVRHGQNYYWCHCDCGAQRVVGLDHLLSVDALSCGHVRHRGFFSINPEHLYCVCGEKRRFFFNRDGFRIWRCGKCEEADIRAYLRREYGDTSSAQFTANMKRPPKFESDYDRFLATLNERIKRVLIRDETILKSIHIDPIEEIDGKGFRFFRLWVEESEKPLTWYHPY